MKEGRKRYLDTHLIFLFLLLFCSGNGIVISAEKGKVSLLIASTLCSSVFLIMQEKISPRLLLISLTELPQRKHIQCYFRTQPPPRECFHPKFIFAVNITKTKSHTHDYYLCFVLKSNWQTSSTRESRGGKPNLEQSRKLISFLSTSFRGSVAALTGGVGGWRRWRKVSWTVRHTNKWGNIENSLERLVRCHCFSLSR